MKSQSIPMSSEEFHRMPRKLGWKHEYWNGEAHITPSKTAVVTASIAIAPRPVQTGYPLRAPTEEDIPELFPAYMVSFQDTIDYCDWPLESIEDAARNNLANFFAGKRGKPLPASCIAIHGDEIVGGAFIIEKKENRPLLDLLFVIPSMHRQGIATALVATALNQLHDAGYEKLFSTYWLGNVESRNWHKNFGFKEEPDLFIARAYYYHAMDQVEYHQQLGDLSEEQMVALIEYRDACERYLDVLNEQSSKYGMHTVLSYLD